MALKLETTDVSYALQRVYSTIQRDGLYLKEINGQMTGATAVGTSLHFDCRSTGGLTHNCHVRIRLSLAGDGCVLVEVLAIDGDCERKGHIDDIEKWLSRRL
jgi:hypothetical protein